MGLTGLKPLFHFNRIVAKRSVFHCVYCVHETMKYATFRYDTVEVEDELKAVIIPCSQHAKLNLNPSPKSNQIFKSSIHQS